MTFMEAPKNWANMTRIIPFPWSQSSCAESHVVSHHDDNDDGDGDIGESDPSKGLRSSSSSWVLSRRFLLQPNTTENTLRGSDLATSDLTSSTGCWFSSGLDADGRVILNRCELVLNPFIVA